MCSRYDQEKKTAKRRRMARSEEGGNTEKEKWNRRKENIYHGREFCSAFKAFKIFKIPLKIWKVSTYSGNEREREREPFFLHNEIETFEWSTFGVKNESMSAFENDDDQVERSNGHAHTHTKKGREKNTKLEHHLIFGADERWLRHATAVSVQSQRDGGETKKPIT